MKKVSGFNSGSRFTLIELLVVIAIIALLAAILLPALQSARDRGRTASCLSNQREAGKFFHMYYSDYKTAVPNIIPIPSDIRRWSNHLVLLYGAPTYADTDHRKKEVPLLRNTPFQCPSPVKTNPATDGIYSSSYELNTYICNYYNNSSGKKLYPYTAPQILLHKDKHPAKRLCAYEKGSTAIVNNNSSTYNLLSTSCRLSKNHSQGKSVNYLFMDGHAENRRGKASTEIYIYQNYDLD